MNLYYPTKTSTRNIIIRSNSPNLTVHGQSDVTFSLPETIEIPSNAHATISVSQATIPITFYMVDDNTDKLVISGTTYLLQHGNYDADLMVTELRSLLTGYTITYNEIPNTITISHTNAFRIEASSTCLHLLGFTTSQLLPPNVGATSHTGLHQVDFSGVKAIDIMIRGLHTKTINTTMIDDDIIARVPIDVAQKEGGIQQYHPAIPQRALLPNFTIDELRIVLADEDGDHSLIFHGGIWTVMVSIDIVHSPRDPKVANMRTEEARIKNLRIKQNGKDRPKDK